MVLGLPKASVWKLVSWLSVALAFHSMEHKKNRALRDQKGWEKNQSEQGWGTLICVQESQNKKWCTVPAQTVGIPTGGIHLGNGHHCPHGEMVNRKLCVMWKNYSHTGSQDPPSQGIPPEKGGSSLS